MDSRERETILEDLLHEDEELRRLAVERTSMLPAEEAVAALVAQLGDASWRVRKAAIDRLAASADVSSTARALVGSLSDGDNPGRRNAAVEALVRCGPASLPVLLEATRDPDVDVRKQVVDVLAGIAHPGSAERLVELLGDPDANVRGAAADALGAVASSDAVPVLVDAAATDAEPLVRLSSLRALARMEAAVSPGQLVGVLDDPLLRPPASVLLGSSDDPGALDVLVKGLSSNSRSAREAAMHALVTVAVRNTPDVVADRIRAGWDDPAPGLEDAFERVVDGPLSNRLALVQFLGLVRPEGAVVPLLRAGCDEALEEVVLTVLSGFGEGAEGQVDSFWDALEAESQVLACGVLGRSQGAVGEARLRRTLDARDAQLRVAAARALGKRRAEAAVPELVARLEAAGSRDYDEPDESEEVAEAIVAVVGHEAATPGLVERTLGLLDERIDGATDAYRLAATRILGRLGRPADLGRLQLALTDPAEHVRRAAVEALARVVPGAVEPLRLAMADESPMVRIGATKALAASGAPEAMADLATLAEDEDPRVRASAMRAVGSFMTHTPEPEAGRERALSVLAAGIRRGGSIGLAALESLKAVGGPGVVALAQGSLADADPEIVGSALACIGEHGGSDDLKTIQDLLAHDHWAVRAQATQIAAERRYGMAVPAILRRLDIEQDDFVRNAILRALAVLEG
jgi:HEAT repeat protein